MNFILLLESEVYFFLNQTKLVLDTRFYQAGDIGFVKLKCIQYILRICNLRV